jgi:regulator of sirC expression with transglutaminase-like and TPR domain
MDVVERFTSLVAGAPHEVPLDETALLIAARARGPEAVDIDESRRRLDDLAHGCEEATFEHARRHLFERCGFGGNTEHYDDPANSFLDLVLERRTGIPITLSVVLIEVARRLGVPVVGVGMPGHFIVRDETSGVHCDPFGGGRLLDRDACAAMFTAVTRGSVEFDDSVLAPVTPIQVLARMLNNLEHGPFAADSVRLAGLLDLHLALPGLPPADRVALASRLATAGRFDDAARVVEAAADVAPDAATAAMREHARAFRARLN